VLGPRLRPAASEHHLPAGPDLDRALALTARRPVVAGVELSRPPRRVDRREGIRPAALTCGADGRQRTQAPYSPPARPSRRADPHNESGQGRQRLDRLLAGRGRTSFAPVVADGRPIGTPDRPGRSADLRPVAFAHVSTSGQAHMSPTFRPATGSGNSRQGSRCLHARDSPHHSWSRRRRDAACRGASESKEAFGSSTCRSVADAIHSANVS
jgi:hypothetical protein